MHSDSLPKAKSDSSHSLCQKLGGAALHWLAVQQELGCVDLLTAFHLVAIVGKHSRKLGFGYAVSPPVARPIDLDQFSRVIGKNQTSTVPRESLDGPLWRIQVLQNSQNVNKVCTVQVQMGKVQAIQITIGNAVIPHRQVRWKIG